jgi:hypothetical protein
VIDAGSRVPKLGKEFEEFKEFELVGSWVEQIL